MKSRLPPRIPSLSKYTLPCITNSNKWSLDKWNILSEKSWWLTQWNCLTVIPEKLVLLRCPLRVSKIVEVVYVKFSSLNSPSTPASTAALEFKVEFSFKSKQLRILKWCLTSRDHMHALLRTVCLTYVICIPTLWLCTDTQCTLTLQLDTFQYIFSTIPVRVLLRARARIHVAS